MDLCWWRALAHLTRSNHSTDMPSGDHGTHILVEGSHEGGSDWIVHSGFWLYWEDYWVVGCVLYDDQVPRHREVQIPADGYLVCVSDPLCPAPREAIEVIARLHERLVDAEGALGSWTHPLQLAG